MRFITGTRITRFIVIIWLILWVNFIVRDLAKRGDFAEYMALVRAGREGKYSIVYGERYYEFLEFVKENIPETPAAATYGFDGVEMYSLDYRRGVYYLYPLLPGAEDPEYIFSYGEPFSGKNGYYLYKRLDKERFILKRGKAGE